MIDDAKNALVWAEIDLGAIAHNVRELRRLTRPEAGLMAVLKANGYGHGAVPVARTALANGAVSLGVARLGEAITLREQGITAPILVFGYTPPALAGHLLGYDLTQTVYARDPASALAQAATAAGGKLKVHVKVDTGMGRLGVLLPRGRGENGGSQESLHGVAPFPRGQGETEGRARIPGATGTLPRGSGEDTCRGSVAPAGVTAGVRGGGPQAAGAPEGSPAAEREIEEIMRLPGLEVEGLYTHFAGADLGDKSHAKAQLARFLSLIDRLRRRGMEFRTTHAANSAAVIELPEAHLDLVRPGISLYGLYPSGEVDRTRVALKPAMSLKSRIIQLQRVPAGFEVSYGMTYETPQATVIATVAVGYADGLSRFLSSRGRMLAGGRSVPIAGRVCMDLTMLDVGERDDLRLGDEVVIFGRQGDLILPVDEVASRAGTISYEVVSLISERVPRVYLDSVPVGEVDEARRGCRENPGNPGANVNEARGGAA